MDFYYLSIITLIFIGLLLFKYLNISATVSSIILLAVLGLDNFKNVEAGYLICFVYIALAFVHYYRRTERKEIYAKFNDSISSKAFVNVFGKVSLIVLAAALQYKLMFLALLSYGFADSLASQIGIFTKSKTISIISFKEVIAGTNGGISILGTSLGILGGLLLALLASFLYPTLSILNLVIYSLIGGLLGNMIDSILGELVENRFKLYDWTNNFLTELVILVICLMIM